MKAFLSLVLALGLLVPAVASAQEAGLAIELQRIRRDLSDLQRYVYSGKKPPRGALPSGDLGGEAVSRMQVQIQGLEAQIRELTGRVEKAEFGVTSLKERVDRMANDFEARFQALEQGRSAGAAVAPQPDAPQPSGQGIPTGQRSGQLKPGQLILGTVPRSSGGEPPKPAAFVARVDLARISRPSRPGVCRRRTSSRPARCRHGRLLRT